MLAVVISLLIFVKCLPDARYTVPGDTKIIIINKQISQTLLLLLKQSWVHSSRHSNANLLTPGSCEGKCSVY